MRRVLLALGLAAACTGSDPLLERVRSAEVTIGDLDVARAYALPPFTDAPMPLYLTVTNRGATADTLVAVRGGEGFPAPMMHGSGMGMLDALPVPAGGALRLEPGALHLMFDPPLPPVARGDSIAVTLTFRRAGSVTIWAPVIGYDEVDAVREE
ncbi:MAG: copper chaperone PCu(A)C [Gemmatimonadetes bacterium]|nr:copper chaperone PCu(A)C [Gemmatimonadota bacterium]HRX19130.1 copper chaperone PCu(A)C [Gemmatimonadales bacterium]